MYISQWPLNDEELLHAVITSSQNWHELNIRQQDRRTRRDTVSRRNVYNRQMATRSRLVVEELRYHQLCSQLSADCELRVAPTPSTPSQSPSPPQEIGHPSNCPPKSKDVIVERSVTFVDFSDSQTGSTAYSGGILRFALNNIIDLQCLVCVCVDAWTDCLTACNWSQH